VSERLHDDDDNSSEGFDMKEIDGADVGGADGRRVQRCIFSVSSDIRGP
jgi:hypothetical protein